MNCVLLACAIWFFFFTLSFLSVASIYFFFEATPRSRLQKLYYLCWRFQWSSGISLVSLRCLSLVINTLSDTLGGSWYSNQKRMLFLTDSDPDFSKLSHLLSFNSRDWNGDKFHRPQEGSNSLYCIAVSSECLTSCGNNSFMPPNINSPRMQLPKNRGLCSRLFAHLQQCQTGGRCSTNTS